MEQEIQVGETQTIIPQERTHCACAYLFNLVDGELMLAAFPEESGGFTSSRSSDGGHTWRDAPTWPTWCAYQFPDGELIQVHSRFLTDTDQDGVYETVLDRSMDNSYSYQRETVQLIGVPTLAPETIEPGRPRYVDHSIVALRDRSPLAGALAKSASDRQPKERSFVVRSTDRGRTWHYVSKVAFDLTPGDAHRLNGFGEPSLQTLPNGEIQRYRIPVRPE